MNEDVKALEIVSIAFNGLKKGNAPVDALLTVENIFSERVGDKQISSVYETETDPSEKTTDFFYMSWEISCTNREIHSALQSALKEANEGHTDETIVWVSQEYYGNGCDKFIEIHLKI